MPRYECQKCLAVFDDKEALCVDWRIEEKSFICPSCRIPLSKPNKFQPFMVKLSERSHSLIVAFGMTFTFAHLYYFGGPDVNRPAQLLGMFYVPAAYAVVSLWSFIYLSIGIKKAHPIEA